MKTTRSAVLAMALLGTVLCPCVWAQDADQSDLAQDLTNPVADLLTIPVQLNYDQNIGPAADGWKLQTNFVLPKP
jgi:hypothetical protein